ncbi:MAG TPA: hypothetical protein VF407_20840 [Polyangiaceae bacterium]
MQNTPKRPKLAAGVLALMGLAACMDVPVDSQPGVPPSGVIKGTVLYQGAHPCTQDGHVVGALIVLAFAADNPPPPGGLATTAVNFGVVSGDELFANEPRQTQPGVRTCAPGNISASAPFAISPFDAGTYVLQAFYDTTGNFLPTFKIRNLPEKGDVGGGYIDTADAQLHAGDPNYQPIFLPVTVGTPGANGVVTMPDTGFVADNVAVTVGESLPFTRPYFHPDGADTLPNPAGPTPANPGGTPQYVPIVTMTEDQQVLAPPATPLPDVVQNFQNSFPQVRLDWGVAASEQQAALDPKQPFRMQAPTYDQGGGLLVWQAGGLIPEGQIPSLYPLAVFAKLNDDPQHENDPQSLAAQGSDTLPIVIIQGITLAQDSVFQSVLGGAAASPSDPNARVDHLTALVRPSVVCLDPRHIDKGGTLVTPHLTGPSADPNETVPDGGKPLFDPAAIKAAQPKLINKITQGCLPLGRYQINLVYSTGQAWTVPNEAGSCAAAEGAVGPASTAPNAPPADGVQSCQTKPRAVLPSQGTRAILEIVPSTSGDSFCKQFPVPQECVQNPP